MIVIFKVTKEHRQNLAEGAKKKLNECKNNIKKIQNNHVKKVSEDELSDEVVFFYLFLCKEITVLYSLCLE